MPGKAKFAFSAAMLPALALQLSACTAVKDMKTSFSGDSIHPQEQMANMPEQRAFYAERRRPLNNPPVDGDSRYSGMYGQNMMAMPAGQAGSPEAGYPQGLPPSPGNAGTAMAMGFPGAENGFGANPGGMSAADAFASGGGGMDMASAGQYGGGGYGAGQQYNGGAADYSTPYSAGGYNSNAYAGGAAPVGFNAGAPSYGNGGSDMPLDLNGGFPGDNNAGQYGLPYRAQAGDPYAGQQNYAAQGGYPQQQQYGGYNGGAAAYGTDAYANNAYGVGQAYDAQGGYGYGAQPQASYGQQQGYGQQPQAYGQQGYGTAAPGYGDPYAQYGQPSVGYGDQQSGDYGDGYYGGGDMSAADPSVYSPMAAGKTSVPDSRLRYAARNRTAYYNSFADANPVANSDISY